MFKIVSSRAFLTLFLDKVSPIEINCQAKAPTDNRKLVLLGERGDTDNQKTI